METHDVSVLDAAGELAERLVRSAVRKGGTTRWATSRFMGADSESTPSVLTQHDLYQGNAGIALFLWEAGSAFRSDRMSTFALDGLVSALQMAELELPSEGYLTGSVGTGLAAVAIGLRAGDERLAARGLALVHRSEDAIGSSHRNDLTSGLAGSILALLRLHSLLGDERLLTVARDAGMRLASTARWHAGGCSWQAQVSWVRRDPTGIAHGATGIAMAFSALGEYFPKDGFAELSTLACAHEDRVANRWNAPLNDFRVFELETVEASGAVAIARLWKQLREHPVQPAVGSIWCNGESGVLLGRSLMHGPATLHSFPAARRVAERILQDWSPEGGSDSICHGRVGSLLAVWTFATAIADQPLRSAVTQRIARRLREPTPWWSGTWRGSPDSTLFLGDAGIGLALLHLQNGTDENASVPLIGPMLQARWPAVDPYSQSIEAANILLGDRTYHRTRKAHVVDESAPSTSSDQRRYLRMLSRQDAAPSRRYLALADRLERVMRRDPPDLGLLLLCGISPDRGLDDAASGVWEKLPWVNVLPGYVKVGGSRTGIDRAPANASGATLLFDATLEDPFVPCSPFASAVLQEYRLPSRSIDVAIRLAEAFEIDREASGFDELVMQQTIELRRARFLFWSPASEDNAPSAYRLLEQQGTS